eukprot:TRINITY_DN52236_c0_g1_i1.p1 TRINITY_DN52236_c0_g1~~TRINITY_DN52236_c0_g1_i1.p1  ORF type:complete len:117 (+),score=18.58 TRINITY_DN52236_c0_g1_i1:117-467(+)
MSRGVSDIALGIQVDNEEKWRKKWEVENERRRLRKQTEKEALACSRPSTALSAVISAASGDVASSRSFGSGGGVGRHDASARHGLNKVASTPNLSSHRPPTGCFWMPRTPGSSVYS